MMGLVSGSIVISTCIWVLNDRLYCPIDWQYVQTDKFRKSDVIQFGKQKHIFFNDQYLLDKERLCTIFCPHFWQIPYGCYHHQIPCPLHVQYSSFCHDFYWSQVFRTFLIVFLAIIVYSGQGLLFRYFLWLVGEKEYLRDHKLLHKFIVVT